MNVLEITLKNKQINEILQDDLFVQAFEYANEAGFVTCSMLQRKYPISYPKARAFYEVMSLFKGAEYNAKDYKMKVNFSEETIGRVKNKGIKAGKNFKRINYLDD